MYKKGASQAEAGRQDGERRREGKRGEEKPTGQTFGGMRGAKGFKEKERPEGLP
jgi:hypothetical protein